MENKVNKIYKIFGVFSILGLGIPVLISNIPNILRINLIIILILFFYLTKKLYF